MHHKYLFSKKVRSTLYVNHGTLNIGKEIIKQGGTVMPFLLVTIFSVLLLVIYV